MKKLLAFVTVALTAVAMASADPIVFVHGFFGVGLGSTVTQADGSALSTVGGTTNSWVFGSNLSYGGGVNVNIPFGGKFGIQTGVDFYFNNIGYESTATVLGQKNVHGNTYSYTSLDIPVLFTIKYNKFNIAAGPYISIPLTDISNPWTNEVTTTVGINSKTDGTNTYTASWGSVGLSFGLGYEERVGLGRFVFGGRYMMDLIPIDVKTVSGDSETVNCQLLRRAFVIDIAYKLPLSL